MLEAQAVRVIVCVETDRRTCRLHHSTADEMLPYRHDRTSGVQHRDAAGRFLIESLLTTAVPDDP